MLQKHKYSIHNPTLEQKFLWLVEAAVIMEISKPGNVKSLDDLKNHQKWL